MKRKTTIILSMITLIIAAGAWNNMAMSDSSGAPATTAGVPGEYNCSFCHSGSAISQGGIITSDLDTSGYTPGKTYNITASLQSTHNTFGFEICPKAAKGTNHGTVKVTDAAQTKISTSGGKQYITHTYAGHTGSANSKTWTFQWIAPVAGTGNVTLYGAFNAANGDGSSSGDKIILSSLLLKENTSATSGIALQGNAAGKVGVYPNPAHDVMHYTIVLDKPAILNVSMKDINGRSYQLISNSSKNAGTLELTYDLNGFAPGLYFLDIATGDNNYLQKVMVQ